MATRKTRTKSKSRSKPLIQLDPERREEIIAVALVILGVLTALGAFNLSGGMLLGPWVQFLQTFLGWGVFLAPVILLGLGVALFLDALDKMVDIGWERPLGLGIFYLLFLTLLHWFSGPNLLQAPPARGGAWGGGLVGWSIASLLVKALGEVGGLLAVGALGVVAAVLLFNVSLIQVLRAVAGIVRGALSLLVEAWRRIPKRLPEIAVKPAPAHERTETARSFAPRSAPFQTPVYPLDEERPDAPLQEGDYMPVDEPSLEEAVQMALPPPPPPEYHLPQTSDILEEGIEQEVSPQEIRSRVRQIEDTLLHFGVPTKIIEVNQGPTITQFGVEPGFVEQKGIDGKVHRVKVKVSRISALQHDLELALAAAPIRIEAPVPGRSVVGIEVPNSHVAVVSLRSVVESEEFRNKKRKLAIALGQDVEGQPVCADLASMPHLLIAGATGSGKSVCVNTIIATLLCTMTPSDVRFVMVDPKRVELVNFNSVPHLLQPVVVDVAGAVAALQAAVREMDERFKLFAEKHARNIETYNRLMEETPEEKLPFQVIIVDELADLMMVAADEVERTITRLAQMARATGIHLILATQRPSVDVVTGLIKANFPARISFAVTSQIDSRVVLDSPGAEKLLGRGDMLYMASDSSKLHRLQGCYVSDGELEKLVDYWKQFEPPPASAPGRSGAPLPAPAEEPVTNGSEEEMVQKAVQVIRKENKASVSLLQRKLGIGYPRASKLMDKLVDRGLVGPDGGATRGRAVLEPPPPPAAPSPKGNRPAPSSPDEYTDWTDKDWADLDKA